MKRIQLLTPLPLTVHARYANHFKIQPRLPLILIHNSMYDMSYNDTSMKIAIQNDWKDIVRWRKTFTEKERISATELCNAIDKNTRTELWEFMNKEILFHQIQIEHIRTLKHYI